MSRMAKGLLEKFGLRSLQVSKALVHYSGREPQPVNFYTARCMGQCSGGDFDQEEALERELDRMYVQGLTVGRVLVSCRRKKDTLPRGRSGPPRAPSRTARRATAQTCLGSLSASVIVEYADGHPRL